MMYSSRVFVLYLSLQSLMLVQCGGADKSSSSSSSNGSSAGHSGAGGGDDGGSGAGGRDDGGSSTGGSGTGHGGPAGTGGSGGAQSSSAGPEDLVQGVLGEVITLAGTYDESGNQDGAGRLGLLTEPMDLVSDGKHIYVVEGDPGNRIRTIDIATGAISTLAGSGRDRFADGVGTAAEFHNPSGLVIDPAHENLYVADDDNSLIRKVVIKTGDVTTIAGRVMGINSYEAGSDDGIGTAASFREPAGLAIDSKGKYLYVADMSNHEIRRIDLDTREVTTLAGSTTAGAQDGIGALASFATPQGIAIDPTDSKLYVADSNNDEIRMVDLATREVTTFAGSPMNFITADGVGQAAGFNKFRAITIDPTGTYLYVAEGLADVVRKIEIATRTVTTFAGSADESGCANGIGTEARFSWPEGLTVVGKNLFVADSSSQEIRAIALDTAAVTTFAGSHAPATFGGPKGVTSDGTYLYVADSGNGTIRKVSMASGNTTTIAGAFGTFGHADGIGDLASFDFPSGVATDGTRLYIADTNNSLIRSLDLTSFEVKTLAGTPEVTGSADGVGSAATFNLPQGIVSDPTGQNLYVTDRYNHSIRKIVVSSGKVTTLAGSTVSGFVDGTGAVARFNMPSLLVLSPNGKTLYVTDSLNHAIRSIDIATGEVTTLAGSTTSGFEDGIGTDARFDSPWGIATDGTYVYVADSANHALRRITLATAEVTTLCGGKDAGYTDGVGENAEFNQPAGLTLDPTYSFLYVSDFLNREIRRVRVK